jgi:hypothetical protein
MDSVNRQSEYISFLYFETQVFILHYFSLLRFFFVLKLLAGEVKKKEKVFRTSFCLPTKTVFASQPVT